MVPKPGTRRCASEEAEPRSGVDWRVPHRNECQQGRWSPKGGGLWNPISVGEENETFFIRTWKALIEGKAQRGQYLLVVDLGSYKWYQSQTLGDAPARRLNPGGWIGGSHIEMSVSKDLGPWKGVDCEIPYRLGRRTKQECGNLSLRETEREKPKENSIY